MRVLLHSISMPHAKVRHELSWQSQHEMEAIYIEVVQKGTEKKNVIDSFHKYLNIKDVMNAYKLGTLQ